MTLVLLFVMLVITPSAVAAIDITQDDWNERYNESEHDPSNLYGNNNNLDVVAVNLTDDKVRFKSNVSGGGLDKDNGLQIYIDSEPSGDDGLDTSTEAGSLSTFFDGLDDLNADYRISVTDSGVPIIQEHDGGLSFDTIQTIEMEEDGDQIALEVDRETIGDPDPFKLKFAYIDDISNADKKSKFLWANETATKISGNSVSNQENAVIDATVEFGDENIDDTDKSEIVFTLTDDNGEVGTPKVIDDYSSNGKRSVTFEEDAANFEGTVELEVEVNDDSDYSTDRESLNNTVTIGQNGLSGQNYNAYIALSIVEAGVTFGDEPTDDTTVDYTLRDNDGDDVGSAEDSNFELGTDTPLNKTFTVNPYNFKGSGELEVDVDDEDYPLTETKSIDSISEGSSLSSTTNPSSHLAFDADTIGHKFTLNIKESSLNFDSDDGFTLEVYLESIANNDGKNITRIDHVVEFDDRLNIEDDSQDVSLGDTYENEVVSNSTSAGEYAITLRNISDNAPDHVLRNGTNETLYEIDFTFEDGLKEDTDQGEANALEFNPTTINDDTELLNLTSGENPSFTSSNTAPVKVVNQDTTLTDVSVTHVTDGTDMANRPMEYSVDVESNDGELDYITLNRTDNGTIEKFPDRSGYPDDNLVYDCDTEESNATCETDPNLRYTPKPENTTGNVPGYNDDFKVNITVVDSGGNKYYVQPADVEQGSLRTEVHVFGDVTGDTSVTAKDVRKVLNNVGETSGGRPWGDQDQELATYDINNDGEITMRDVTLVYDEFTS